MSDLKNNIAECDKNLELAIVEQMLSLIDNEKQQNKRKILKSFTIKHLTKTVSDGENCKALNRTITKLFDKLSDETTNKLTPHYIDLKWIFL